MTQIKKIATSFGTIQLKTAGDGWPLILVHGLFSSMESFLPLFSRLAEQRQLVAFDFPDHGDSTIGPKFEGGWAGYVEVLKAVADELGFTQFDLCGHSMGGGVAAMFAGQYPERVRQLALIDSVTARFRLPLKGKLPQIPLIGDFVFKVLYREKLFFNYFKNDVFFDASKMNEQRIHTYYEGFNANRAAILRAVRATANPDPVVQRLAHVEADTVVIWGRNDPLIPLFVGNETVRKVKRATLQIIENCGHSPMEECADQTSAILADFFTP